MVEGRVSATNAFDTTSPIPADGVNLTTTKANSTDQAAFGYNATWGYRGVIVVPPGPNVTWTFAEQFDDSVYFTVDGNAGVINNQAWDAPTKATLTLAPGLHPFELRLGQGTGGVGPNNGWALGFGIDFQGRDALDPSFFSPFTDPGDGSFLRFDDDTGINYNIANQVSLQLTTEVFVKQFGANLNGNISGAGGLNKTGAGKLTLAGTNNYAGPTTISAGVLEVGSGGATGTLGSGAVANSGILRFNRSGTVNVPNSISGTGSLEQDGPGITELAGVNTYTGSTDIDAGTLLVSGSLSGSAVHVNAGGTLGGTGIINGVVDIDAGGFLAPGGSPGTLTMTSLDISAAVTAINSGALRFDLASVVSSDKVLLTSGPLTIGSGLLEFNDFVFSLGSLGVGSYTLFDTNQPISGTLGANLSGPLGADYFGTLSYANGTNDIVLDVVPEPGSLSLLGVGAALALVRRRRKTV